MASPVTIHSGGLPIGATNPLSFGEPSISGFVAITPSDTVQVAAKRQFQIVCTVAGNVKIMFSDGSTNTIPVSVGLSIFTWAVIQVFVTSTTATATYGNLV